jgi:membrane fusion protein (multidrug efflux system)
LLVALLGCGADEEPVAAEVAPQKLIRVQTLKVAPGDLQEEFTLPGSLEAWQDLLLAAEVAGPVDWVGPEEGDRISRGEELVRIDSLTLRANRDSARSDYNLRQKTLARMERLVEEQLVSTQELDSAASTLDMSAAALRSAEVMLDKGSLTSPLDGLLEERFVDPGEYIKVGAPLIRVVRIDRLKINVDVPEKDIHFLKKGASIRVVGAEINGLERSAIQGEITHIAYVADPVTRTYRVRLKIDNRKGNLRPGMIVRAYFVRRSLENVLAVPLYAVVERDGEKYIFIKEGASVRRQAVRLDGTVAGEVVVAAGLKEGEEVVIKGQQLLNDGDLVELEE